MDEKIKYTLKICIFVLFAFAIINMLSVNLNTEETQQKISDIALIEGLQLDIQHGTQNLATGSQAFCDSYKGSSGILNGVCGKLTEKNCNETSCCVFANKKCVAGSASGPTYNTGENGKTNTMHYYFQNQCYGDDCPTV